MEKAGRNDPCPCGSGKKFKKCCENKDSHKKIQAQVLSSGNAPSITQETSKVSRSFFQRAVQSITTKQAATDPKKYKVN